VPHEVLVSEALVDVLVREGVEYVFGVPGGPLTPLFEAMHARKSLRLVLAKHEGGAAFMSAAHARVTGRLAVCCCTTGPGATNALTGIASAFSDGLPVLLLTGQVATHLYGRGAVQDSSSFGTDLVAIFRPVTNLSCALPSAARSVDVLRAALRAALAGRQGPAHVSMPADILYQKVSYEPVAPARYRPAASSAMVDAEAVAQAAALLQHAARPCLLAGHGVLRANAAMQLLQLAEASNTPVATTPKGKSVFPEQHRLSLGVVGFGGCEAAEQYIQHPDTDVILVVGSSLGELATNGWRLQLRPKTALIQLDRDPAVMGRNYPIDVALICDARVALGELAKAARVSIASRLGDSARAVARESAAARTIDPESLHDERTPLHPARVIHELREAMPDDACLFVDAGNAVLWAVHYFETRQPGTFFIDLTYASMGHAVAGVVGAALADRSRRVVALTGDAAFAMNGLEVHTAVEERLPVTWVVLNDGGHGMVAQGDRLNHGRDLEVTAFATPIDAALLAQSVGACGFTARSPPELRRALHDALASQRPTVIDAVIDRSVMAPMLNRRVKTLTSFRAGELGPR
jgi:acetolactate synthase I/II/III large subunit